MKTMKGYFVQKQNLSNIEEAVEVSQSVAYIPEDTRFGKSVPDFYEFLKFCNVKYLTKGFYNYNGLNLTTQVPARVSHYVSQPLEITYPHWIKCYPTEVPSDLGIFDNFNIPEYMVYDCLVNFEIIGFDYYRTNEKLIAGILKRAEEIAKVHEFDIEKVKLMAKNTNPKLKTFGV